MIEASIIIALIVGIVEAAKRTGMDSRWAPILAIVLGVAYSFGMTEVDVAVNVVEGIIYGLTAAGLYSGTKTVAVGK